jgi:molecular chaperone DnaK (HSP70)
MTNAEAHPPAEVAIGLDVGTTPVKVAAFRPGIVLAPDVQPSESAHCSRRRAGRCKDPTPSSRRREALSPNA